MHQTEKRDDNDDQREVHHARQRTSIFRLFRDFVEKRTTSKFA